MPTVLDEATVTAYLDLVRQGVRLGDAAQHLGISRAAPTRRSRVDAGFAAALVEAREVGAKVRRDKVPHDEYRYNMLGCRCPECTRAATVGRAGRRAATTDDEPAGKETTGDVHPIRAGRVGVGESSTSFLLARAS